MKVSDQEKKTTGLFHLRSLFNLASGLLHKVTPP